MTILEFQTHSELISILKEHSYFHTPAFYVFKLFIKNRPGFYKLKKNHRKMQASKKIIL